MDSYLMGNYDENLMENIFFQTLQKDFCELFFKAISEGCVICVPRTGSLPRILLTLEDFLTHILMPTDELPESHFRNLCGAEIKISNKVVKVDLEAGKEAKVVIHFQETFYTSEGLKYEVLCVEQPFDGGLNVPQNMKTTVPRNLRDCLDLLWIESESHDIETIDREIGEFLKKATYSNNSNNLKLVIDAVNSLYNKCIQILLKNAKLKKKYKIDKTLIKNLEIAIEAYIQHGIYKKIMRDISAITAHDDARLNKMIRNCSDLHFKDFNIKTEFYTSVPKARVELSRINGYRTSLGKIGCLRRTVSTLAEPQKHKLALSADDLLQLLAFLIIKTNLPNWNAQLKFLKVFQFSEFSNFDENNFLVTSLEAAIVYVQCGDFYTSNGEGVHENFKSDSEKMSLKERTIHHFFHQIALGDLDKVKEEMQMDAKICDYGSLNLCHPLCTCDRCSCVINKNLCDGFFSAKCCDDKGLTPLHIAAMYGVPNIVEYLLANEADVSASDNDGRTPLHYAALRGHQNALLLLIHNNAEINALDNSSNSPLHLCVNNGHESCVKALIYFSEYLGVRLQINQKNTRGDTPLHNASKWGYLNIVKLLLENGADPEILNKRKCSPINYALNVKVASLLKEKSHRVTNFIKIKPLNPALDLCDQGDKSQNQVFKGVQANSIDAMKKVEKVLKAVENGDVNLVCFYLGIDASEFEKAHVITPQADTNHEEKCHPLCVCAKCEVKGVDKTPSGDLKQRKRGLNINICNSEGYTPLHVASKHNHLDLVKGFIHNGALLNAQTSKLLTPLMLACQYQNLKVVKELLGAGCQTDLQDYKLNTALHYASETGNVKLVEILLKYEPNVSLKNSENKTPVTIAKEKFSIGIIQILKGEKSLDLNEF